MTHRDRLTNSWFFEDPPTWMRPLLIFIKGDMLILIPLLITIGIIGIWDQQLMIILFLATGFIRALGEMFYWLLQQFGP